MITEYGVTIMNELMVTIDGGQSWIYFKTEKENDVDALSDFFEKLERVGINCDNVQIDSWELRMGEG